MHVHGGGGGRARGVRRGSMRAGGAGEGGRRGGGRGWPKGTPLWAEGDGRKPRAHVATFEWRRVWRLLRCSFGFVGVLLDVSLLFFWCLVLFVCVGLVY